ncbi:MAG: hypothetical protein HC904_05180, partial [Blastochloris sp.]|nr:hypothetical protein [Blastochloris sp.]
SQMPEGSDLSKVCALASCFIVANFNSCLKTLDSHPTEITEVPTIEIHANGRITASNFPFFSETNQGFEYRFEDFLSMDTTWTQAVVGGIGDGTGNIKDHQGISLAHLPTHLSSPGFTGTRKVDGLIFGFGDPDSGDALIFRKKPSANSKP